LKTTEIGLEPNTNRSRVRSPIYPKDMNTIDSLTPFKTGTPSTSDVQPFYSNRSLPGMAQLLKNNSQKNHHSKTGIA